MHITDCIHGLKGPTCHFNLPQPIFLHLHLARLKCLTQIKKVLPKNRKREPITYLMQAFTLSAHISLLFPTLRTQILTTKDSYLT